MPRPSVQCSGRSHGGGECGGRSMMPGSKRVRVRIAPSPAGDPHVGTAIRRCSTWRCAGAAGHLCCASKTPIAWVVPESERQIFESLRWLEARVGRGPDVGGPFGPYRRVRRCPCMVSTPRRWSRRARHRGAGARQSAWRERAEMQARKRPAKYGPVLPRQERGGASGRRGVGAPSGSDAIPDEGTTCFTDVVRGRSNSRTG